MKYSVLTIEPDPKQRRQIIHALIKANYDAIPMHFNYALHELHSLRDLDQDAPNVVVLSDQLSSEFLEQLIHPLYCGDGGHFLDWFWAQRSGTLVCQTSCPLYQ